MGADPISLALGIASLISGVAGTGAAIKGAADASSASRRAERTRKKMAAIEAMRARRERIKAASFARAQSTSNAANQGALGSSSFLGAGSQITSQLNRGLVGINQNQALGNQIFSANADIASGQSLQSFGSGLQNVGDSLFKISSSPFFNKSETNP